MLIVLYSCSWHWFPSTANTTHKQADNPILSVDKRCISDTISKDITIDTNDALSCLRANITILSIRF